MNRDLSIALADDQALVREGLKAVINQLDGVHVVLEAQSGEGVLQGIEQGQTLDVVVSDIRMPGIDGIELARRVRALDAPIPVLLLTTFDDSELMLQAVEAGAQGFLLKDISPQDLHHAIVEVAAGGGLLQPVSTSQLQSRLQFDDQSAPSEPFTEREIAILRLLAGGYSNREIARSIFLAEGTVKNYVSDILAKLDTRDRTRAVLKAITLRII